MHMQVCNCMQYLRSTYRILHTKGSCIEPTVRVKTFYPPQLFENISAMTDNL